MERQHITLFTECVFTRLAFDNIQLNIFDMTKPPRKLAIIGTESFSSFAGLNDFMQIQFARNDFTDYLFLKNNETRWRKIRFPCEIHLDESLFLCKLMLTYRLHQQPNAATVKAFMVKESKRREFTGAEHSVAAFMAQGVSLRQMSKIRKVSVKTLYGQVSAVRRKSL
jgi:hypothetical protein